MVLNHYREPVFELTTVEFFARAKTNRMASHFSFNETRDQSVTKMQLNYFVTSIVVMKSFNSNVIYTYASMLLFYLNFISFQGILIVECY